MKSNFTVILSIKFTDFYILYTIFYLLLGRGFLGDKNRKIGT